MKKSRRIARWLHRGRHGVVELALPRQVTPTRAPCDPAQSMTVLLVAPMGIESAVMTAAMLDLGVGRVLRITSTATLRHVNHVPAHGDVAIVRPTHRCAEGRLLRHLKCAGWSEIIINRGGGANAGDSLASPCDQGHPTDVDHRWPALIRPGRPRTNRPPARPARRSH